MMAGYPYYTPYYQTGYQPIMPQPAQAQSPTTSGIIWVSGAQEAQMYPVAPNNAVALWENNGKTIYLKQADATGKPTIRIYDLTERIETPPSIPDQQDGKTIDYVTKSELAAIIDSVKSITNDVETMKGDLYGVAGRKKSTRKAEVEEDDT